MYVVKKYLRNWFHIFKLFNTIYPERKDTKKHVLTVNKAAPSVKYFKFSCTNLCSGNKSNLDNGCPTHFWVGASHRHDVEALLMSPRSLSLYHHTLLGGELTIRLHSNQAKTNGGKNRDFDLEMRFYSEICFCFVNGKRQNICILLKWCGFRHRHNVPSRCRTLFVFTAVSHISGVNVCAPRWTRKLNGLSFLKRGGTSRSFCCLWKPRGTNSGTPICEIKMDTLNK